MHRGKALAASAADRLLAFETGGKPGGADAGVAIARRIHDKLQQHLSPVIGDLGFDALFARAVKLAKPKAPALIPVDTAASVDDTFEQVCACLAPLSPVAIHDIVAVLLSAFVNLLSTFIGEGLTWKLLRNAWPEALPTEPPSGEKP